MSKRVLLLIMPFLTLRRPHLGIGLLKAALNHAGMECDVRYFNFRLADIIGTEIYERIAEGSPTHEMPGEWIFTTALYGEDARPAGDFLSAIQGSLKSYDGAFLREIDRTRNLSPAFIHDCISQLDLSLYDIVGLTSTFQQNLASLAMAREIKRRAPGIVTVFGGANFEGEMGVELHRRFPFMDIVCSGEADHVLPELVRRLRAGLPIHDMGGVTSRVNGQTVTGSAEQTFIKDMDALPYPDHTDFFRDFKTSRSSQIIVPEVTMETSRGCWWGQKHHCTFCGLNGLSMTYRSKSPGRAYREIRHLLSSYGPCSIYNTDNIIDLRYFSELFPRLEADGIRLQLFYETKANLKKTQLASFKRLGSSSFQPGIESLNSHVLALMDKGVKGIQNVQLLRWSKEMRLDCVWNILCGFPGETPEDYRQVIGWIRRMPHLQPPIVLTRFRLDRFSPMFNDPEKYSITDVRPYTGHTLCYPFPEESLRRIAYFLDCKAPITPDTMTEIHNMWAAVEEWRMAAEHSTLNCHVGAASLRIIDRRAGYPPADYEYEGLARYLYLSLDGVHSESHLLELARAKYPRSNVTSDDVHRILDEFVEHDLVLREDNLYLALALLPETVFNDDTPETVEAAAQTLLPVLA
jgi:ribosomal peptide maturation radical SAM protein 1